MELSLIFKVDDCPRYVLLELKPDWVTYAIWHRRFSFGRAHNFVFIHERLSHATNSEVIHHNVAILDGESELVLVPYGEKKSLPQDGFISLEFSFPYLAMWVFSTSAKTNLLLNSLSKSSMLKMPSVESDVEHIRAKSVPS